MKTRANRKLKSDMFDAMVFKHRIEKYYCMICGTKHKEASCPKCRSKMKRVGS